LKFISKFNLYLFGISIYLVSQGYLFYYTKSPYNPNRPNIFYLHSGSKGSYLKFLSKFKFDKWTFDYLWNLSPAKNYTFLCGTKPSKDLDLYFD